MPTLTQPLPRPFLSHDFEAVHQIARATLTGLDLDRWEEEQLGIARGKIHCLVAEATEGWGWLKRVYIVGFATCQQHDVHPFAFLRVSNIAVLPEYRRRGVGSALWWETLRRWGGVRKRSCHVDEYDLASQLFLRKAGMRCVQVHEGRFLFEGR